MYLTILYNKHLIYKGFDITVVSEILGHKDTSITNKVYIHVVKELREKNKALITQYAAYTIINNEEKQ